MAEDSTALIELMQKADGGQFLRSLAEAVLQLLMEADVDGRIGASRHERSAEWVSYSNGYPPARPVSGGTAMPLL